VGDQHPEPAEPSTPTPSLAIVLVTYQRQELLATLFNSFRQMGEQPQHIVIVDNENSPQTQELAQALERDLPATAVHYAPQQENLGGAGGFHAGVRLAYDLGATWMWLMDDDVAILPHALTHLRRWTRRVDRDLAEGVPLAQTFGVIQGQRLNFDGSPFYWQYRFWPRLGIPNPIAPRPFPPPTTTDDDGPHLPQARSMNTACFEGGLFHRQVVETIGLPDARFFIYWDDTVYGYLASKVTRPIVVSDLVLRRTRTLEHFKLGKVRKLNATSDLARYHILRNRGHMGQYLRLHGDYIPAVFALGTMLTLIKELIRLTITRNVISGAREVLRGLRDARPVLRDPLWVPEPPVAKAP